MFISEATQGIEVYNLDIFIIGNFFLAMTNVKIGMEQGKQKKNKN